MYSICMKIFHNWLQLELTGIFSHYVLKIMDNNYAINCGKEYWEANYTLF